MIIYPLPLAVVVLVVTYYIIHVFQIFIKEYLPGPAAVYTYMVGCFSMANVLADL